MFSQSPYFLAYANRKPKPASLTNLQRFVSDAGYGSGTLRLRRTIPLLFCREELKNSLYPLLAGRDIWFDHFCRINNSVELIFSHKFEL